MLAVLLLLRLAEVRRVVDVLRVGVFLRLGDGVFLAGMFLVKEPSALGYQCLNIFFPKIGRFVS